MKKIKVLLLAAMFALLLASCDSGQLEVFDENAYVGGSVWDPAAISFSEPSMGNVSAKLLIYSITDIASRTHTTYDIPLEMNEACEIPAGAKGYILYTLTNATDQALSDTVAFKLDAQTYRHTDALPNAQGMTFDDGWSHPDPAIQANSSETAQFSRAFDTMIAADGSHTHCAGEIQIEEPTCTEEGLRTVFCGECGEQLAEGVIPATGHTPGEWDVVKESTCSAAGERVQKCVDCGEVLQRESIDVGEHDFVLQSRKDADCTHAGVENYICRICGKTTTKAGGSALGHAFVETSNGVQTCSRCGTALYYVECSYCVFNCAGFSNAESGWVPAGTAITVTCTRSTTDIYWIGSYPMGDNFSPAALSFTYTVQAPCEFDCVSIVN